MDDSDDGPVAVPMMTPLMEMMMGKPDPRIKEMNIAAAKRTASKDRAALILTWGFTFLFLSLLGVLVLALSVKLFVWAY